MRRKLQKRVVHVLGRGFVTLQQRRGRGGRWEVGVVPLPDRFTEFVQRAELTAAQKNGGGANVNNTNGGEART